MEPNRGKKFSFIMIYEVNCYIEPKDVASVWIFPKLPSYDPNQRCEITDYAGVVKLVGPVSRKACDQIMDSVEKLLISLDCQVEKEYTADD